jgi:hypothetical protein
MGMLLLGGELRSEGKIYVGMSPLGGVRTDLIAGDLNRGIAGVSVVKQSNAQCQIKRRPGYRISGTSICIAS